ANVRIQGLDGRYAQILKDGFPLYGGFSGSLSIMQIPPLDLRQVEYIKGSASTLYGGGAISGVINLVSKEPVPEENLFHINASHIGAFDVNVFASRRINKIGLTILAQRNAHRYFDADKDGFTDLPELTKYNFNPKLFFFINERTKLTAGATFTTETRTGGDIFLLKNNNPWYLHYYRERNDVNRITTQLKFDHRFSETNSIAVRNSYNYFYRKLALSYAPFEPEYLFGGHQYSSFSEIAFTNRKTTAVFVTGLNFYIDEFHETRYTTWFRRDEKIWTAGAFAQYTRDLGKKVAIEAGLRADYVLDDKLFVLPRLFTLFKWTDKLTSRIGGGLGYRNPTIFNQESELHGYRNILPITIRPVEAEESYGASADVGFKTPLGKNVFLHINQMFFFTHLKNPLVPVSSPTVYNAIEFMNANGNTISQGLETFFKLGFYDFVLFAGYTFTNVTNTFSGVSQEFTLTPKHSLKGDLLYALPGKWRIGADYEYKSSQLLSNGTRTPEYWTFGFVCERTIRNFVLFGNVENFTNVRQTNFDSLVSAPFGTPQYTEVWSPLDGIVFNAGIKVRL
ncbi:MAG TPA: TonB-dependent receptor plug domain-containing protein, partial [Bacteroidia bacterium]|nr:TonB-dependent receptor plug domain-containing protein [Bacteroidia bacterium]